MAVFSSSLFDSFPLELIWLYYVGKLFESFEYFEDNTINPK